MDGWKTLGLDAVLDDELTPAMWRRVVRQSTHAAMLSVCENNQAACKRYVDSGASAEEAAILILLGSHKELMSRKRLIEQEHARRANFKR